MSAIKKFWTWGKKNIGNALVGAGTVLSVALPPVGAIVTGAGGAINAIKAKKTRSIDPVVLPARETVERLTGVYSVDNSLPSVNKDSVGVVPNFNLLYLVAGGLLFVFLLFKK